MPPTPAQTLAIEESWQAVKGLVVQTVRRWQHSHGGDWHDLMSLGYLAFLLAYRDHDPARALFVTHVGNRVRWVLGREHLHERKHRLPMSLGDHDPPERRCFDLEAFTSALSEDAQLLMQAALEQPLDMLLILFDRGVQQHNAQTLRQALRQFCAEQGWDRARIDSAWREVREALQDAS